jgi:hypothetical protein
MKCRIKYSKPDKNGTRKSIVYTTKNGAEYYVLMNEKERWAKIINAKRRNVIDFLHRSNYNVLRRATRKALFDLGVVFEKEFKPKMSKYGKALNKLSLKKERNEN